MYGATIGTTRYAFPDLKTLLAKATPARSGDALAGIAAASEEERVAAQFALADLPLTALTAAAISGVTPGARRASASASATSDNSQSRNSPTVMWASRRD